MSAIVVGAMEERTTLRGFIRQHMERENLSVRKLADKMGVTHGSINQFLDEGREVRPSVEWLMKLSQATNTNVITLLAMAYPELQGPLNRLTGVDPGTLLRSERIEQLPDEVRDAVDRVLFKPTNTRQQKE